MGINSGKKILIYGAGAIGRGFLAPTFCKLGYEISFVDKDELLINELKSRNEYITAFSNHSHYDLVEVNYKNAYLLGEEDKALKETDFVFSCVGPKNITYFAKKLKSVPTIISFENDCESANRIAMFCDNEHCYFGIPDVIASNDAPNELKRIDPLCLVSEYGELAIQKGNFIFPKEVSTYDSVELERYWNCKFFLHNTPHACAAFLGKLVNAKYLHQAMQQSAIEKTVVSVMNSTKEAMKINKMADSKFIEFYAKKEIARFKDKLLYDPISRVGRDPLRKLQKNDRLIQSLKLIDAANQNTCGISATIKAVLYDAQKNYLADAFEELNEMPTEEKLLERICGLKSDSRLFNEIVSQPLMQLVFA